MLEVPRHMCSCSCPNTIRMIVINAVSCTKAGKVSKGVGHWGGVDGGSDLRMMARM